MVQKKSFFISSKIISFFIYLHGSLGHLFVKLLGANLTPLVYNSPVDFDQRYSTYPTPTYLSNSVSVAKYSIYMNEKTKSARNFIYTLLH